ncbi:hypothetical protein [Nocardioides allogilvus]|uniref:hypothetical protein n=1 Tax=Nocardioides allogilvus TaxID=2072017 RepID=UPI000D2F5172|nr:hypothetical protein [Nocardioides allogilvus]
MSSEPSVPGTARAWGWVAHLRAGGTTPWDAWTGDGVPTARVLPGAQQLELLRRLNLAGRAPDGLADRVLTAAAPGRGKPDLALVGAGRSPYGPQPVDPSLLPPDELIRVATSVLAEDLVALGVSTPPRRLHRIWHRRHRLAGDPIEVAGVRDHLASRGRPPGGPGAPVLVLGGPLDQMLADVWTRRCFERGSFGWLEWLRFWQQRDELPPRIDLAAVADRHRAQSPDVHVVLDRSQLPDLLAVRRLPPPVRQGSDAAELARRIATVVGLLVPPDERAALMTHTLLPRMPATTTPPVALPAEHRAWVQAAAERMARQLSRAGYAVVGDPRAVVPTQSVAPLETAGSPGAASGQQVLDLAVAMLVDDTWKGQG